MIGESKEVWRERLGGAALLAVSLSATGCLAGSDEVAGRDVRPNAAADSAAGTITVDGSCKPEWGAAPECAGPHTLSLADGRVTIGKMWNGLDFQFGILKSKQYPYLGTTVGWTFPLEAPDGETLAPGAYYYAISTWQGDHPPNASLAVAGNYDDRGIFMSRYYTHAHVRVHELPTDDAPNRMAFDVYLEEESFSGKPLSVAVRSDSGVPVDAPLVITPPPSGLPHHAFSLSNPLGDWLIGEPPHFEIIPELGFTFDVAGSNERCVAFGARSASHDWSGMFCAPPGETLGAGATYTGAVSQPIEGTPSAFFVAGGDGRQCKYYRNAAFTVLELERDPAGAVTKAAIDFSYQCFQTPDSFNPPGTGKLRFNSTAEGGAPPATSGAPPGWMCAPEYYDERNGGYCDCNCGAVDPDCARALPVWGCADGQTCAADGTCAPG